VSNAGPRHVPLGGPAGLRPCLGPEVQGGGEGGQRLGTVAPADVRRADGVVRQRLRVGVPRRAPGMMSVSRAMEKVPDN